MRPCASAVAQFPRAHFDKPRAEGSTACATPRVRLLRTLAAAAQLPRGIRDKQGAVVSNPTRQQHPLLPGGLGEVWQPHFVQKNKQRAAASVRKHRQHVRRLLAPKVGVF